MYRQVKEAKWASFNLIFRKIDIYNYYRSVLSDLVGSENTVQK